MSAAAVEDRRAVENTSPLRNKLPVEVKSARPPARLDTEVWVDPVPTMAMVRCPHTRCAVDESEASNRITVSAVLSASPGTRLPPNAVETNGMLESSTKSFCRDRISCQARPGWSW